MQDSGRDPATDAAHRSAAAGTTITGVRLADTTLVLEFDGPAPQPARLAGPREIVEGDAEGQLVRFPLLGTRWGAEQLCLPAGDYEVQVGAAAVRAVLPPPLRHRLFRADLRRTESGLTLRVGPPLAEGESRPRPHRNHRDVYLRGRVRPENAVYFESFYGRSASDNPAGIDRALARLRPDVTRYWSTADASTPIPDGAVRIIEGSAQWWRVRAEARVLVVNDWLRWTFHRRRHQHVLQTWHGTMLKRLALDRPSVSLRQRSAVVRQQARWDALLSQNPYSTQIFRSAYAVRCPIWETGYPRNDVLHDPTHAAHVRRAAGIPEGATVVLYAPTWRDDRTELVDHLDPVRFAAALPAGHVLAVRGHSRTLGHGGDVRGERLIDVTGYPDMAELMLVADVLVTDYSSTMFDFAGTGKPMIFYTPDLEHYGTELRGFYFDLRATAPGPMVTRPGELLAAIGDLASLAVTYSEAYTAWRNRFTPADDGHAGDRVVRRMLDEGWLA